MPAGRRVAPVLAALAVLLTACGPAAARRQPVAVLSAQQEAGDLLVLGVASCHGNPSVRVTESSTAVRVDVRSTVHPDAEAACADGVRIRLSAPLGVRPLVDASTGRAVPVGG